MAAVAANDGALNRRRAAALALAALAFAASPPPQARAQSTDYDRMKRTIESATRLTFSMEASVVGQTGAPGSGLDALQAMFTPGATWKAFDDADLGHGRIDFSYLAAQYWSVANAAALATDVGLVSPLNAYPANVHFYRRLSWTQSTPDERLAVTVGQYPFAAFDGNAYANDQQIGFLSNSMSQNGSQNYSKASLGAYAQILPNGPVTVAGGIHDGNNLTGTTIAFSTVGQGPYAWFLYGAWSPALSRWGTGQYALLYYNLPGVPAQPLASDGLSFSASQPIGRDWGLFVRANTAWNSSFAVQSSVAAGAVLADPLRRGANDQLGLGAAWNRTNAALYPGQPVLASETMLELYWNQAVTPRLLVTPDLQLFLQRALAPGGGMAAVFSLRVTALF